MIKHLHLYDVLNNTRLPISVNFEKVRYYKPNTINSEFTDIYFDKEDKITVWESYEFLQQ